MPLTELYSLLVALLLIHILINNVVITVWCGFMAREFRGLAKQHNGITSALAFFALFLMLNWVWNVWVSTTNTVIAVHNVLDARYTEVDWQRLSWLVFRVIFTDGLVFAMFMIQQRLKHEKSS